MKFPVTNLLVVGIIYGLPFEKTEKLEYVKRGDIEIPFYFPSSTMETYTIDRNSITKRSLTVSETVTFGTNELANRLGLSVSELKIKQSHKDAAGVTHIYASRKINGIVVDNHVASIHIRDGQVLSFTSSFKNTDNFVEPEIVPPVVIVSLEDAVNIASKKLGAPRDNHPASTVYTQLPSGKITYAHQFQLRDDRKRIWFQVVVDASTGQILQVVDYYQEYTYRALKLPKTDPTDGGFENIVDPYKLAMNASPKGWHNDGNKTYIDTKGNNVVSQINGVTLNGTLSGEFTHEWDGSKDPTTEENQKAAIINTFYRL
jgi:extracellular elastinolytic metalloproteinase